MDLSVIDRFGGLTLERKRRIEKNIAESLQRKKEADTAANAKILQEQKDSLYNAAALSNSTALKQKQKMRTVQESIEYTEKYTKKGVAKYVTTIVESALLLDPDAYKLLNPNYHQEIETLIEGFLDHADLNDRVDSRTSIIFESVMKKLPMLKTGILLTEDEVMSKFDTPNGDLADAIDSLAVDVKDRVIDIISTEKDEKDQIQADLDAIIATPGALPEPEEIPTDTADGVIPVTKPQLNENAIVRETPRCGIIETLAVNEAVSAISEGQEYNPDLAIANAIKYVTILETLNVTGLMTTEKQDYKRMCALAGGKLN